MQHRPDTTADARFQRGGPQQELGVAEGLRDVVIDTALKGPHTVLLGIAPTDHDHANVRRASLAAADHPHHIEPGAIRQRHVNQGDLGDTTS